MKTSIDRRTAIASTFAASAIAVSPPLFALDDAGDAEMAKVESSVHTQSDPTRRQFVGHWSFKGKKETFEISLEWDETFTMKCFSVPSAAAGKGEFKWGGKGDWAVRDDSFSLHRTHKWMWVGWGEDSRTIVDWQRVMEITSSEIVLANNARLERL